MASNKETFKLWFSDIIKYLAKNEGAGFSILMITFPLLERYLRSKSNLSAIDPLNSHFYDELLNSFPELNNNAVKFWNVYRHGILHVATFSKQNRKRDEMPNGGVSRDIKEIIKIDSNGNFCVNPVQFAERVINIIENEFSIFEALGVSGIPNIATVQTNSEGYYETSGYAQRNVNIGYNKTKL
jgi:hypothetical protein